MIKRFCDLCGRPAVHAADCYVERKFGEKCIKRRTGLKEQAMLKFSPYFCVDHGDVPDMCLKCVYDLVDELRKKLADEISDEEFRELKCEL